MGNLPDILQCKLPLEWKGSVEMPLGAFMAQAVVIGDKVYIGGSTMYLKKVPGGSAASEEEKRRALCSILEYSTTEEGRQWRTIVAPAAIFAMATVDNQLILAGGVDPNTDQVWVLASDKKTWTQPFPAMPTARVLSSGIGYKRWLVVVGGAATLDSENQLDVVEVLDTSSKQWYQASPLPSPALRPSLDIIQDTLYVAWCDDTEESFGTHQISIPTLISNVISSSRASPGKSSSTEWQQLPEALTPWPALVSFHDHLLAVGDSGTPSSTIAMYLPHTKQWQKVAELPTPRRGCACCFLPSTKQLVVIGGWNDKKDPIFTMEICELESSNQQPSTSTAGVNVPSAASANVAPRRQTGCPTQ